MGSISMARGRQSLYQPMVNRQLRRGDPGLFSFLGGLAKTVSHVAGFIPGIGTAVSAITDEVGNVLGGGGGGGSAKAKRTGGRGGPVLNAGGPAPSIKMARMGASFMTRGNVTQAGTTDQSDPVTGLPVPRGGRSGPVGASNIRGHHLNRSAYTLKDGTHIEKGTKLVANRRRNPGNPRALHRAVSRMASFQHMASRVEHSLAKVARKAIRHRSAPSGGRPGHKPGCGCVACRRR